MFCQKAPINDEPYLSFLKLTNLWKEFDDVVDGFQGRQATRFVLVFELPSKELHVSFHGLAVERIVQQVCH